MFPYLPRLPHRGNVKHPKSHILGFLNITPRKREPTLTENAEKLVF